MIFKKLYLLPISIASLFILEFIIFYFVAVLFGHVSPLVPFISDTGSKFPVSCYFSQMIGLTAGLLAILIYLRYIQVKNVKSLDKVTEKLNVVALVFGWLAAFGISIVASFQISKAPYIHLFGSVTGLGFGCLYQLVMWKVTFNVKDIITIPRFLHPVKLILALISCCMFLSMYTFIGISTAHFHGEDSSKWTEKDGGYEYHLVGSSNEWILAISTNLYIFTMAADFRYYVMEELISVA